MSKSNISPMHVFEIQLKESLNDECVKECIARSLCDQLSKDLTQLLKPQGVSLDIDMVKRRFHSMGKFRSSELYTNYMSLISRAIDKDVPYVLLGYSITGKKCTVSVFGWWTDIKKKSMRIYDLQKSLQETTDSEKDLQICKNLQDSYMGGGFLYDVTSHNVRLFMEPIKTDEKMGYQMEDVDYRDIIIDGNLICSLLHGKNININLIKNHNMAWHMICWALSDNVSHIKELKMRYKRMINTTEMENVIQSSVFAYRKPPLSVHVNIDIWKDTIYNIFEENIDLIASAILTIPSSIITPKTNKLLHLFAGWFCNIDYVNVICHIDYRKPLGQSLIL